MTAALIAYGAVATLALRPITGHIAWTFAGSKHKRHPMLYPAGQAPNGDQWFGAFWLAVFLVCLWPLAVLWWASGKKWQIGAEKQATIAAQKKRLEQLERELNLR